MAAVLPQLHLEEKTDARFLFQEWSKSNGCHSPANHCAERDAVCLDLEFSCEILHIVDKATDAIFPPAPIVWWMLLLL